MNKPAQGMGRIGLYIDPGLEGVYREIEGLLGVALGPNLAASSRGLDNGGTETSANRGTRDAEKTTTAAAKSSNDALELLAKEPERGMFLDYDVILVDGISLSNLQGTGDQTLILVCGPVSGENPGLRLKMLPFNLGLEATRFLMEGREFREKRIDEPLLDLMLEEIRQVLRKEVRNYLECPPIPWGYSYALTLTHDIDILSLKEMPVARTFLGYFYRSSLVNWKRWRSGKVQTSEFFLTLWEMVRTWGAKLGLGHDVWQRALPMLLDLEKRLGVRSSLYFMPFPRKAGILPDALRQDTSGSQQDLPASGVVRQSVSAPANRASFYDIAEQRSLLRRLEENGWEAGVHGIDAWRDSQEAGAEYGRISQLIGQTKIGVRMHWLYFKSPESFKALEEGGFLYDSTFGFNEVAGFRAGTLQPYHPLNCQTLWELPLHIQDGALMGEEHLDLNREEAFKRAKPLLAWAKRCGGAVSLLWHNQSFTAPRFWGEVYERLIAQGKADGAWIAIPRDVLRWFELRRRCRASLRIDGTHWQVSSKLSSDRQIPPVRLRLHVAPERVRKVSVPYEAGEGYIDFPAQDLVTLEVEGVG